MPAVKKSYTIPCSSGFRDRVQALANVGDVNVGDLARSVMLVVPAEAIAATAGAAYRASTAMHVAIEAQFAIVDGNRPALVFTRTMGDF